MNAGQIETSGAWVQIQREHQMVMRTEGTERGGSALHEAATVSVRSRWRADHVLDDRAGDPEVPPNACFLWRWRWTLSSPVRSSSTTTPTSSA
jgi:hypothetical protein